MSRASGTTIAGAGHYEDVLKKENGAWKFLKRAIITEPPPAPPSTRYMFGARPGVCWLRMRRLLWILAALALAAGAAHAQVWRGGFGFYAAPKRPTTRHVRPRLQSLPLMFASDHREKRGWSTDYPGADFNISVRLGELTKTR
jgi:hypothetical protein